MPAKTFVIWETEDGPCMLEKGAESKAHDYSPLWKPLKIFEAKTWAEALQTEYAFFGFGEYNFVTDKETGKPLDYYFKEFKQE